MVRKLEQNEMNDPIVFVLSTFESPIIPEDRIDKPFKDDVPHVLAVNRLTDRLFYLRFLVIFCFVALVVKACTPASSSFNGSFSPYSQFIPNGIPTPTIPYYPTGPVGKSSGSSSTDTSKDSGESWFNPVQSVGPGDNVFYTFLFVDQIIFFTLYFAASIGAYYYWNQTKSKVIIWWFFVISAVSPLYLILIPYFKLSSADKATKLASAYTILLTVGEIVGSVMFIAVRTLSSAYNWHYTAYGNPRVLHMRNVTSNAYYFICVVMFGAAIQGCTLSDETGMSSFGMTELYLAIPLFFVMILKKHIENYYANQRAIPPLLVTSLCNIFIFVIWVYYLVKLGLVFDIMGWVAQNYLTYIFLLDFVCKEFPPNDDVSDIVNSLAIEPEINFDKWTAHMHAKVSDFVENPKLTTDTLV